MNKICKKCGLSWPLDNFYVHKQMGDGHLNHCKDCVKYRVRLHRAKNVDRIRAYDRARGARQTADDIILYRKQNPEKYYAHCKVNNAIRDKRIEKPSRCVNCGKQCHLHGHHEDYSKPLFVEWLCPVCHNKRHIKSIAI